MLATETKTKMTMLMKFNRCVAPAGLVRHNFVLVHNKKNKLKLKVAAVLAQNLYRNSLCVAR